MALTKADFAERLFEELGLNKREAKEMVELFLKKSRVLWRRANKSKFPVLENSSFVIKPAVPVETQKQARKFP